jgi:ABC-type transporter MlaC component
MRVGIRFAALMAMIATWATASNASDAPAAEARAAIAPVFAEITATARDAQISPEQKRALIEHELSIWIDFGGMALRALGPRAESFSREQLAEFVQEFERYLTDVYIRRIVRYRDNDVEIKSASYDEKSGLATIRILGGASLAGTARVTRQAWKPRADVDYVLHKRRGEWRIVAVRIEGVDMARFFGDQFEAVLARSDPDGLISNLRKRNAEREGENPFE